MALKPDGDRDGKRSYQELSFVPEDEPGMAERFQRGLRRALNTPPQHRTKPEAALKSKERPASKGRRREQS